MSLDVSFARWSFTQTTPSANLLPFAVGGALFVPNTRASRAEPEGLLGVGQLVCFCDAKTDTVDVVRLSGIKERLYTSIEQEQTTTLMNSFLSSWSRARLGGHKTSWSMLECCCLLREVQA